MPYVDNGNKYTNNFHKVLMLTLQSRNTAAIIPVQYTDTESSSALAYVLAPWEMNV